LSFGAYPNPRAAAGGSESLSEPDKSISARPADVRTLTKSELEGYDGSYDGTQYTKEQL